MTKPGKPKRELLHVRVTSKMLRRLDEARGRKSRSAFVREAITTAMAASRPGFDETDPSEA